MEEKTESATPDNGVKISFGRKELESYSFLFDAIEDRTLRFLFDSSLLGIAIADASWYCVLLTREVAANER